MERLFVVQCLVEQGQLVKQFEVNFGDLVAAVVTKNLIDICQCVALNCAICPVGGTIQGLTRVGVQEGKLAIR